MITFKDPDSEDAGMWPDISASPGLSAWLVANRVSIACTSYQTGQLFLLGVKPDGQANVDQHSFNHAMGLCYDGGRLWLGSHTEVWRLENVLAPDEMYAGLFDALFVPRACHVTGAIDIHEIGLAGGELVFVNTHFSCLGKLDQKHSFQPVWKPKFITELLGQDRCHLNGMCVSQGAVKYVTAAGTSDEPRGWKKKRATGGVIIDVESNEVIATGLCMPHSPRLYDGKLYALNSGRGWLVQVDVESGDSTRVAFGRGFLRGLSFVGRYAIVGSSKPRDKTFKGLPLEGALKKRRLDPASGIFVVDLESGETVEWLLFETKIDETFDVAILPNVACPVSIGLGTPDIAGKVSFKLLSSGSADQATEGGLTRAFHHHADASEQPS